MPWGLPGEMGVAMNEEAFVGAKAGRNRSTLGIGRLMSVTNEWQARSTGLAEISARRG
jgi:hypothetical protein